MPYAATQTPDHTTNHTTPTTTDMPHNNTTTKTTQGTHLGGTLNISKRHPATHQTHSAIPQNSPQAHPHLPQPTAQLPVSLSSTHTHLGSTATPGLHHGDGLHAQAAEPQTPSAARAALPTAAPLREKPAGWKDMSKQTRKQWHRRARPY